MKVLVVGGGAREHALCWKLRQSPLLTDLYCAPGNPGIGEIADLVPIAAEEIVRLADFAADLHIDLTVVGPELPLTLGIANEFRARGLAIFGPDREAAEIEGSKVFAKEFMVRHGIPTSEFRIASSPEEARAAAVALGFPVVLKADGLASGKGVLIPGDRAELEAALGVLFEERRFGNSADRVVVERYETGEEISFMALADGERLLPLAVSKDYKRLGDGDSGPNTGGMGAHSPAGLLPVEESLGIVERVLRPALAGLAAENRRFVGVLYAGLMMTAEGPKVLEFNARFGDPEAQTLMLRLEDDLVEVLAEGAAGQFERARLRFRKETAACVVLASQGYPEKPATGEVITGLEDAVGHPAVEVFHGATAARGERTVTAGGRVLSVCATAPDLAGALRVAYAAAQTLDFPGKVFRTDIGKRVLEG